MRDDTVAMVAMVLYLLSLPLYPFTVSLMQEGGSNVVIAAATVVNVVVTAIYAFFTWGLWRETRAAACTAAEQADTTRQVFEAAHRPHLEIHARYERLGDEQWFHFHFKNHGSVPATIVTWALTITRGNEVVHASFEDSLSVKLVVFPQASTEEVPDLTQSVPAALGPTEVDAVVNYGGLAGRHYSTRLRKVLIVTEGAVRFFLVEATTDVD